MYDCFKPQKTIEGLEMYIEERGLTRIDVQWYIISGRLEDLMYELEKADPRFKGVYDLYIKEKKSERR